MARIATPGFLSNQYDAQNVLMKLPSDAFSLLEILHSNLQRNMFISRGFLVVQTTDPRHPSRDHHFLP